MLVYSTKVLVKHAILSKKYDDFGMGMDDVHFAPPDGR